MCLVLDGSGFQIDPSRDFKHGIIYFCQINELTWSSGTSPQNYGTFGQLDF